MREPVRDYVKRIINEYEFEDPILDCGAGWEPNYYESLFPNRRYLKQDMQDYDPPCIDIVCDICAMGEVEDKSIGFVLLMETLEHIASPQKALDEIHRILKPNGLFILTTVMGMGIHRCPMDYWRFCPDGIELLLKAFKIVDFTLEGYPSFPLGIWITAQKSLGSEDLGRLPEPTLVKAPREDKFKRINRILKPFNVELRRVSKSRPGY
jgi:SAM-dependent methyltransferase